MSSTVYIDHDLDKVLLMSTDDFTPNGDPVYVEMTIAEYHEWLDRTKDINN